MNRRERWIMTISLSIGMFMAILLGSLNVTDFGGALAQDSSTAKSALAQTTAATPPADTSNGDAQASAVDVVKMVSPAVVTVINEQQVQLQNGSSSLQPVGSGTGFIIDTDGHIVTNWHVVNGGSEFQVVFSDGTRVDAKLVGSDQVSDLAVVKVEATCRAWSPLGDSDAIEVGESVLAIGSPLGDFQNTVTEGIVSATNRDFPAAVRASTTT